MSEFIKRAKNILEKFENPIAISKRIWYNNQVLCLYMSGLTGVKNAKNGEV